MSLNFESLSLTSENDGAVAKIQASGFDKIRCSLTGQVVAQIDLQMIVAAVDYMRFENPTVSDSQIIDQMQIRWLVQCARPAMHLTSFQSHDAHHYLVNHHPRDMFAILFSRMLFEHSKIDREMSLVDATKSKLFWLIQLQESEFFQTFGDKMKETLAALIRLDAIHSIRSVFYSDKMRALAADVRDEIPTELMLATFVEQVESHGLNALTKRDTPPAGNRQSLNAALYQAGLMPWQIRIKENEAKQKTQSLEFAAKVVEKMRLSELERIKAGYADKHTVVLADLEGQIHPLLKQKFESAIERDKERAAAAKEKANPSEKKAKPNKASIRAANRFANLDFSL